MRDNSRAAETGSDAGLRFKGCDVEVVSSVTITQVEESQEWVSRDVMCELKRQLGKWGVQSHEPLYWVGILGEEYGEACKEAIEWGIRKPEEESLESLYTELSHVAAVAIAAMECLRRTLVDVA